VDAPILTAVIIKKMTISSKMVPIIEEMILDLFNAISANIVVGNFPVLLSVLPAIKRKGELISN